MKIQDVVDQITTLKAQLLRFGVQAVTSLSRPVAPGLGQVVYEGDTLLMKVWNGVSWITQTNLRMFGVGAAVNGSVNTVVETASIPFKLQMTTLVASTDGSGNIVWTFPNAFPNGLICVLPTMGFDFGGLFLAITATSVSTATVTVYDTTGAKKLSFGPIRISLLAVGW